MLWLLSSVAKLQCNYGEKPGPSYQQSVGGSVPGTWSLTSVCSSAFCVKVDTATGMCQPLAPSCRDAAMDRVGMSVRGIVAKDSACGAFALCATGTSPGVTVLDLQCLSHICLQAGWLFPARTQQSERWDVHGRGQRGSAFGPESCSRDGFEAVPCSYTGLCGCGNKSPGAGTAPACSMGSEITVCCHSLA